MTAYGSGGQGWAQQPRPPGDPQQPPPGYPQPQQAFGYPQQSQPEHFPPQQAPHALSENPYANLGNAAGPPAFPAAPGNPGTPMPPWQGPQEPPPGPQVIELPDDGRVGEVADGHLAHDPGGTHVGALGEQPHLEIETDRRLIHHAGQLPAPDDPDRVRRIHGSNPNDGHERMGP